MLSNTDTLATCVIRNLRKTSDTQTRTGQQHVKQYTCSKDGLDYLDSWSSRPQVRLARFAKTASHFVQ
uniref:Uncharacterized protein n=1 Tax=Heterorhabditis bacteriophora TaxID=37862 RepID=A0A1I7WZR7_HETBA